MRYDKKSSALSELKAKRQERERKDQERKEKKELENRDTEGKESSSGEGAEYAAGKRKSFKKERSRSRSSSSSRYFNYSHGLVKSRMNFISQLWLSNTAIFLFI